MSQPDSKQFAKHLLWHIASLRADIGQFRHQYLGYMASLSGTPEKELDEKWKQQHAEIRDAIYQQALRDAKIDDHPDEPPAADRGGGRL